MKVAIAVTDVLTGMNATVAILAAVEHRHISGQGQRIDLALLDSIVHFGSNQIVGMFASGEVPGRWGNEHPNLAPYQVFRSADGHFIVGAGNDGQFRRLCKVLGCDALGTDPRFRTVADRNAHRPALIDELQRVMATRNTAHWVERLAEVNVPSAPINDYQQVFEHPQVKHRKLRVDQPHGGGGVVSTVANPIRLSATPIEYRIAPPLLGEHSVAVLADLLGKSRAEIDRLVNDGVVGRPPPAAAEPG